MSEVYFPGFNFEEHELPLTLAKGFVSVSRESACKTSTLPRAATDSLLVPDRKGMIGKDEVIEEPPIGNLRIARRLFLNTLIRTGNQTGERLLTRGRRIKFVAPEVLEPQDEEERQALIKRYGEYILCGSSGDCTRNPDGTFNIRIGYLGLEDTVTIDEVVGTMAHDYGHTLCQDIGSVFEELKADAFSNFMLSIYYGVPYINIEADQSTVHSKARNYLYQLLEAGINERQIIAHLIGQRFGGANPDDYQKYL